MSSIEEDIGPTESQEDLMIDLDEEFEAEGFEEDGEA